MKTLAIVSLIGLVLGVIAYELFRIRKLPQELIGLKEAEELAKGFGLFVLPSSTAAEGLVTLFEVAHAAIVSAEPVTRTADFVSFYSRLRRTIVAWAHEGSPLV